MIIIVKIIVVIVRIIVILVAIIRIRGLIESPSGIEAINNASFGPQRSLDVTEFGSFGAPRF